MSVQENYLCCRSGIKRVRESQHGEAALMMPEGLSAKHCTVNEEGRKKMKDNESMYDRGRERMGHKHTFMMMLSSQQHVCKDDIIQLNFALLCICYRV